jgi:hypothetical protein
MSLWEHDWAWSLPLIVGTIVTHVLVLGYVTRKGTMILTRWGERGESILLICVLLGIIALLATVLLAVEAIAWGLTYLRIGALHDTQAAILYSLNAITAFGHTDLRLAPRWELMGALEALNGIILFGLTISFLFVTIQSAFLRREPRQVQRIDGGADHP